ncbi:MAG: hypothetical protein AAF988_04945 [Pseudomonadota bacterium]
MRQNHTSSKQHGSIGQSKSLFMIALELLAIVLSIGVTLFFARPIHLLTDGLAVPFLQPLLGEFAGLVWLGFVYVLVFSVALLWLTARLTRWATRNAI